MSYDYFSKQRMQYILTKLKTIFDTKLNINSSTSTSKRFYGVDVDGTQILEPNKYGSYDEIRKYEDYLYEVNYSNLDYDNAYEYFNSRKISLNNGACSVLKKGNLIGRNFDWTYDENVSFIVNTSGNENRYASIGMSGGATNLTKTIVESGEFNDAYKIVPFLLVDGVNECGVFIEENVVPQDYGKTTGTTPAVELKESLCSLMVVRFVLDHFATAQSAVEYLRDYTSIYSPKGLDDMHYDVHFFISDKDSTYVIEFVENEIQIIDLSNTNKIMTNFHLYNTTMDSNGKVIINRDGSGVNSSGVTANGSGLERYNLIIDNYENITNAEDMRDVTNILKYTNAYNLMYPNFWYTEFTGINGLDVTSPISDYTTTVEDAAEKYSHRSRDKESEYFGTWQTTHSAVYDLDNYILRLLVQEGNNEFSFPIIHKVNVIDNLTSTSTTDALSANQGRVLNDSKASKEIYDDTSINMGRAEGSTIGARSFAFGVENLIASGECSHAEGTACTASGKCSHAEGYNCKSSDQYTHAEGYNCTAFGGYSYAKGYQCSAYGTYSHAEGYRCIANGTYSHAEGAACTANGDYSFVTGKYNSTDYNNIYARITGNGRSGYLSNAETLDWDGNLKLAGNVVDKSNKKLANIGMLSDDWDSSLTYDFGDYCIYNDKLWKCLFTNTNIAPTDGTYWKSTNIINLLPITLTGTLNVGQTSIIFTDNNITNDSLIDIYTNVYGVNPTNIVQSGNTLTLTFNAQQSNVSVKIVIL